MSDVPAPPDGLVAYGRGRKLWRAVLDEWDATSVELELLAEVCRTVDVLDELRDRIAADGSMVEGSQGQPVLHPAIVECRQQRGELRRLLSALGLPSEAVEATATSRKARKAARARWGNRGLEAVK